MTPLYLQPRPPPPSSLVPAAVPAAELLTPLLSLDRLNLPDESGYDVSMEE